jgi:nicotinic acid phosphoribosyltransferase
MQVTPSAWSPSSSAVSPGGGWLSMIPLGVCTDSYKAGHASMYPEANKMVAYGEFRKGYEGDKKDKRFVFFGMRYLVENFLNHKWTRAEVESAAAFYETHNAGFTPYPFPTDLFLKFVEENDGYFPIKVQALPEGTCAHIHVPVYQITAENEYSRLVTFFETLLTQVWYPTTVATLSRRCRDLIANGFKRSVEPEHAWMLDFKLHDFGFRGCTSLEQSVIGGTAHLLNFLGTDTMSAAYYAQFVLNGGKPVGQSIPATEHSVMTSWRTEREAIENMIDKYGTGVFACVLDSYDYANCLNNILPQIAEKKKKAGGHFVLRPDSGDPVEAVLMGLEAAEKAFGADTNKLGFKVVRNASVIQGDGINCTSLHRILDAVLSAGFSAQSVTFGMGGGLLQKIDRDTMSFATKLSYIEYADGRTREVMKYPKTDAEKISLPGILKVVRDSQGIPTVYPADSAVEGDDLLQVVYDKRPVQVRHEAFTDLRTRVETEWSKLPPDHDPVSAELRHKIDLWVQGMKSQLVAQPTSS